jgi:hypothetical protein
VILSSPAYLIGARVDRVGPDSNLLVTTPVRSTAYASIKEAYDAMRPNSYGKRAAVGIVQLGDSYYGYRLVSDHTTLLQWWGDDTGPSRHPVRTDDLGVRGYRFMPGSILKAIIDGTELVLPDGTGYGVAAPAPKR